MEGSFIGPPGTSQFAGGNASITIGPSTRLFGGSFAENGSFSYSDGPLAPVALSMYSSAYLMLGHQSYYGGPMWMSMFVGNDGTEYLGYSGTVGGVALALGVTWTGDQMQCRGIFDINGEELPVIYVSGQLFT